MTDRPDHLLDARGLLCPLPVLKLRKRIGALAPGAVIEVWADDPAAVVDIPHYCREAGHALLDMAEAGAHQVYRVARGA